MGGDRQGGYGREDRLILVIAYLKRMSKVDAVSALLCYIFDIAASAAAMRSVISSGSLGIAAEAQLAAFAAYIAFDMGLAYASAVGRHSKALLAMLHIFLVFQEFAAAALAIVGFCGSLALGGALASEKAMHFVSCYRRRESIKAANGPEGGGSVE